MTARIPALALAAIAALGAAACSTDRAADASAPIPAGAIHLGDRLPDFELPDYFTGEAVRLADFVDGESFVVVLWHSPACPCANNCVVAVAEQLKPEDYPDLRIVAVVSDMFWDYHWFRADLEEQVESGLVPFPVLLDKDRAVMELYGAERTPTVWLADRDGRVRFFGAPENTLSPGAPDHKFLLKNALDALIAGRDPDPATFPPIGCLIEVPDEA